MAEIKPANLVPDASGGWRRRAMVGAAGLALVLLPSVVGENFVVYIATLVLLNIIGALSLHLILRTGQMSMGHAAFLGIGSYTSVLCVMSLKLPWIVGFVLGGALSALVALVVGPIILRLRGVYFVLVTFTLGEMIRLGMVEWAGLTGGSNGIFQIPPPWPALARPEYYYYLALVVAACCTLFARRLLASDFGLAMDAIKESENLAESSGIPVFRIKVVVFAIACGMIGLQGSLTAHFVHFIAPNSFTFEHSLQFVVINVIGGLGSMWGPIVGTVFMVALPELLRGWASYQWFLYGIALVLVMAYLPGGLIQLGTRLAELAKGKREGA
jgi:branched-chain amino acid transport system permease protein